MKIQILLVVTAFMYCHGAPTVAPTQAATTEAPPATTGKSVDKLREDLINFAEKIDAHIKAEVKKLQDDHREHLAMGLLADLENLDLVAYELKNTQPGPEALKLLETELFILENRIVEEVRFIESLSDETTKTEDQLIAFTMNLRKWIAREVSYLKTIEGKDKERAERAIEILQIQDMRLVEITNDLIHSKTFHELQRTEVELRKIDHRVIDEIRHLNREFPKPTAVPPTTALPPSTA